MSIATITLSSKGQVVIPKEIRDEVAVVRQLIAGNSVFVSRAVLLETEWVLRARYKVTPTVRRQLSWV